MLTNILLGTLMMVLTTGVHSVFTFFTFTTLGYGGIVLPDRWRLLASFEAANGIIVFGWITAMVMAVVQRAFATLLEHGQRNKESSD